MRLRWVWPRSSGRLEVLVQGKSIAEGARSAGVTRATVYRWLKTDPAFRAAYNQWHEEMEERTRSRLMIIASEKATAAVERALENGDARMALQLLRELGLVKPSGERLTEMAEVKKRVELDAMKRKIGMEEEGRKMVSEAKVQRGLDRVLEREFPG
jgi:alkanesulfonate monooxygenase SsuD/methylene tetrahydromethanopterin reductase-like flavin-dependent oxidoreductase (luciferase family)